MFRQILIGVITINPALTITITKNKSTIKNEQIN